ncbi:MAG: hypothetical protein M1831_004062 [Alyxoria varia]|nr:MAG: hypothetical protein M1831_004062 [Alyxoria varia]
MNDIFPPHERTDRLLANWEDDDTDEEMDEIGQEQLDGVANYMMKNGEGKYWTTKELSDATRHAFDPRDRSQEAIFRDLFREHVFWLDALGTVHFSSTAWSEDGNTVQSSFIEYLGKWVFRHARRANLPNVQILKPGQIDPTVRKTNPRNQDEEINRILVNPNDSQSGSTDDDSSPKK